MVKVKSAAESFLRGANAAETALAVTSAVSPQDSGVMNDVGSVLLALPDSGVMSLGELRKKLDLKDWELGRAIDAARDAQLVAVQGEGTDMTVQPTSLGQQFALKEKSRLLSF